MWSLRPLVGRRDPRSLKRSLRCVGLAVAVGVAEDGQEGHVHDVERAVVPGHAEDRAEALGEDDRVLAVAEQEDAADRLGLVRPDLVHRVLGDEQRRRRARWRPGTGYWTAGTVGDQADLEPFGDLRAGPVRGGGQGEAEPGEQRGPGPPGASERHVRQPLRSSRVRGGRSAGQPDGGRSGRDGGRGDAPIPARLYRLAAPGFNALPTIPRSIVSCPCPDRRRLATKRRRTHRKRTNSEIR